MKWIVDEIYRDPDSIRELALELEFTSRARNFPGVRSTRTTVPEEIQRALSLLGIKDAASERFPYNGCFQLMRTADRKHSYVHADASARWAGLVYLSPKTEPEGGTRFYRHKETGLFRFPEAPESEALRQIVRRDRLKPSCWQEIDRVGFVYNRFVFYDAQLFHCNGKTWGASLKNGRLTHNFFL